MICDDPTYDGANLLATKASGAGAFTNYTNQPQQQYASQISSYGATLGTTSHTYDVLGSAVDADSVSRDAVA